MKHKANPELIDAENPEWSEEDFQRARPAAEMLPELFGEEVAAEVLKPRGRPKAAATKAHVNIRLDADVLEAFKATGPGWQTRINRALRDWLKDRKLSELRRD
ncbi:MAG: BrnA antitoxin family protein [Syntrophobacteraceae bacterium]